MPKTLEEAKAIIKELNAENAERRVENKGIKDALEGFDAGDQATFLENLQLTVKDPEAGAIAWRDMSRAMLNDDTKFVDGIAAPTATNTGDKETKVSEENAPAAVTMADFEAFMAKRDQATADATAAANKEATASAEAEKIYEEVEALGFDRGTTGFKLMFALAQDQVDQGNKVDFTELAPKAAAAAGIELKTETTETKTKTEHAASTDLGNTATGDNKTKTMSEEAEEAGMTLLEFGLERAASRFGNG